MLATIVIAYGLLLICGWALQRRLLYFPTRLAPGDAEQSAAAEGFIPWRNSNGDIIGWKLPSTSPPTGSLLIVHGNAGCATDRGYIAQPIHEAVAQDVFVLEYPGYGARGGAPGLDHWLAAGEDALGLLSKEQPVYVVSESIGAGVAAHLARKFPARIGGLLLFAPYDDLAAVAQSKMPVLLPYVFLRDRFKPTEWLKAYRGPVKIIVAERDEIISPRFGRRLYDSYAGPKELQVVAGANHNDIAAQTPEWWRDVFAFWSARGPDPKTPPE
jgi:pimeloyl-ACP methyl ester carboxylesterase